MPARKKCRSIQQIMEERSVEIMRKNLPNEWVIHDYVPDYGIDKIVELFEYKDDTRIAETLGELFFVQLKSIDKSEIKKIKTYPRFNIEHYHSEIYSFSDDEPIEIEVIKFQIETNDLLTIQSMGSGIPVLLFLVALDLERVFFVCLNDLIEKVISPLDPAWTDKETKTISIPTRNEVLNNSQNLIPLHYYAKRVKIYSAFVKFNYQESEIKYHLSDLIFNFENGFYGEDKNYKGCVNTSEIEPYKMKILFFIERLKSLDIWNSKVKWPILAVHYEKLNIIESLLSESTINLPDFCTLTYRTWSGLRNLTNVYEENCKEWYLPTHYSQTFD